MKPASRPSPARPRKTLPDRLLEGISILFLVAMIVGFLASRMSLNQVADGPSPVKADLATFANELQNFRTDCNRYPTTAEGLGALRQRPRGLRSWKGPYILTPIALDPWGHPYHYECPGPNGPDSYLLESFGSDGAPGGVGDAADIVESP